jgi:hypothetical protein
MTWCVVGDFGNQIARFEDDVKLKMKLAVKKISIEVFSRVVLKSPVDSGRFRGNWQLAVGAVPRGTLDLFDKTGIATISMADAKLMGVSAGDTVYLANNLPYARRLEEGYSTQAPQGMVALTVQEFAEIVGKIGIELSIQ